MGVVGCVCISKHKTGILLKDEPLVVMILYPLPFYLWLPPLLMVPLTLQLLYYRSLSHSLCSLIHPCGYKCCHPQGCFRWVSLGTPAHSSAPCKPIPIPRPVPLLVNVDTSLPPAPQPILHVQSSQQRSTDPSASSLWLPSSPSPRPMSDPGPW